MRPRSYLLLLAQSRRLEPTWPVSAFDAQCSYTPPWGPRQQL